LARKGFACSVCKRAEVIFPSFTVLVVSLLLMQRHAVASAKKEEF
jgi:hypothetical protein